MNIMHRIVVAVSFVAFLLLYSYHAVEGDMNAFKQSNLTVVPASADMFETKTAGSSASIQ